MQAALVRLVPAASLLLAVATTAGAQEADDQFANRHPLRTGTYIVDGGASISSLSQGDGDRFTQVVLAPTLSRFVHPRWAVGASTNLAYGSGNGITSSGVGIGPVVHHYFAAAPARLLPFVSVAARVQRTRFDAGAARQRQNTLDIEGDAGLTYLLVPQVGITGTAYAQSSRVRVSVSQPGTPTGTARRNAVGLRFGVTAFVR